MFIAFQGRTNHHVIQGQAVVIVVDTDVMIMTIMIMVAMDVSLGNTQHPRVDMVSCRICDYSSLTTSDQIF